MHFFGGVEAIAWLRTVFWLEPTTLRTKFLVYDKRGCLMRESQAQRLIFVFVEFQEIPDKVIHSIIKISW